MINADLKEYTLETHYCNFRNKDIKNLSDHITSGFSTDKEKAIAIFNWVRDNINYRVGLWQRTASQTLQERAGTCTNKANLIVALMRLNGIPAGYGVLRTKGQEYIGPVVIPVLRRRIAEVSTHVYVFAYLGDKWLKCDPSADFRLSQSTVSLNPQSRLVVWDGQSDATEDLDSNHILSEKGPLANIDHMIKKKSKNGRGIVIKVANLYVEFLRDNASKARNIHELESLFYGWLTKEKHLHILVYYFKLITWYKDKKTHFNDHFWAKYMSVYDVMDRAIPYREMVSLIIKNGDFGPSQSVLDAGSGTGIISIAIKNSGAHVISVDNSHHAMRIHKEKDSNAELVFADLRQKLPFSDDHFDRISCVHTLHVLSPLDRESIIGEFFRVLKPGGKIVLVNPSVNFNSTRIFKEHVSRSIGSLGLKKAVYDLVMFTIPIIKMFYYNFILEFGKNSYKYLETNEQHRYLNGVGFTNVSNTQEVYANSAVLNWATKPL
jgi:ubiquinone/menaquinone biosynthesis C-methylase UbiE